MTFLPTDIIAEIAQYDIYLFVNTRQTSSTMKRLIDDIPLDTMHWDGYLRGSNIQHGRWEVGNMRQSTVTATTYVKGFKHGLESQTCIHGGLTEAYYQRDKLHGLARVWTADNILIYECPYKENEKHGMLREWHPTGALKIQCFYVEGQKHGVYRWYHSNGNLHYDYNYVMGDRVGLCRRWFPDGQLRSHGTYKNDKLDGLYMEWNEKGGLEKEIIFDNGTVKMSYRIDFMDEN